ncbi:MAG: signal peptidase II [Actinomycetota bacterium]
MNLLQRPARWLYVSAILVLLIDAGAKALARGALADGPPIVVIPGVLHLTYTTNTGGAFGLLEGLPWLFALATIGVSIAIVWAAPRVKRPFVAVALGMILGGALGNLADRLSGGLSMDGTVTDFIDFRIWPVFNLADTAIVLGALLLVFAGVRGDHADAKGDPGEAAVAEEPDGKRDGGD